LTPTQTPSLFFSFPFRAFIGSRPTFIYGTVGERGLAHGAWRAITTSGVLEGPPPPWRLCPTWNRPGVLLEGPPRTPPWLEGPPPPMWGDGDGPQQGGCPEKSNNHVHCWRVLRVNNGCRTGLRERGCHRSSLCFDDGRRQFTNVFSSLNPSNGFLGGLCFRPETRPPPRLHEGGCPRSPLRTLLPGQREELVPAHPTWDVP